MYSNIKNKYNLKRKFGKEKMPESQSSKLRKKWPWDWEKEELTDAVQVEIVENLYSYAKDVAYWYPTEQGWHYWYNGLETYCQVSRDYFVKVAKGGPDFLKPKLSKITEEAFELINMLMEWANQKYSLCFVTEPDKRFYNIPYSDEELANKWDTVVQKLNLYMNSGNQEEKPAETKQNATLAKPERESWLWKLYEKTLKVIVDAVLERVWHP